MNQHSSPGPFSDPDIAARLDRLPVTRLHWAIVVLCALGLLFDVVEAALSNALATVFSAPPHHVAPYQLSLLLASVFAGGAVGAPLMGWLADRHGRRMALGTALLVLAVTSTVAAGSTDIGWLTVFRVFSGMALGAYPPLMVAYLSDVLPPARRGMLIMICGAIGFLGAPAVIFLIRWLTPLQPFGLDAWRWALLSGAVLIEKGFRVADSLLYLGITMFGPVAGVLLASVLIDRIERRTALALCGALMALLGLGFAASDTPLPLMVAGIAFNLIGAIYVAALSIYGAELFPTALRAAASSGAWAVNRVASALVPLALVPVLKSGGAMVMFAVVAAALVCSIALVLACGPRGLARRPVE